MRALAARLALLGLALAAAAPAAAQGQDDPYCTASYGTEPAQAGPPVRFGIDSELAGSVGAAQGDAKPLDWEQDVAALRRLTPDGKQMVLRVNRLFWSEGDAGIARFRAIVDKHAAAGFDSEIQVRYHPAEGDEGDLDAWEAYVRKVVRTLGSDPHVLSMTITNEVNLNVSGNTSDGAYDGAREALLRGVVAARHEADRIGRRDLQLGFTYAYRWLPQSDAAFWTALAAGGKRFRAALDFVGVDVYPGTFYPPVISPLSSPGEEVVKAIATVRRCYMPKAQLGAGVPIWITENGAQSGAAGDDAGQAAALEDMVSSVVAHSGTYNVSDYRWFNLRDNVTGSPAMFDTAGLVRDDYSDKPALERYRTLVAAHGAARPAPAPAQQAPAGGGARATAASARHGRTVVSLEFDVATADQARALPLLARHGMKATFFVNSGFVGEPGHLTWGQLQELQAQGHEIAGQTISHAHLPRSSPARVRHQVCTDRRRLLAHGLAADAFAYPFGAYSSAVRAVVMSCGYSSARLASGIAGGAKACSGCPYAETIPPRSRFATRMPAAVQRNSSLYRLTKAVRQAQRRGGGWVQLLMHHVCDRCHRYAISLTRLRKLLRWLDRQRDVDVRTVSQLLDGGGPRVRVDAPVVVGRRATLPVRYHAPYGVRRVRFFAGGRQIGVRRIAPWRLKWIPTGLRRGRHDIRALLEDGRGNAAISPRVVVLKR